MNPINNQEQGKSLLDTYLNYHNLALHSTTHEPPKRDGMPFMPMLLMDAMNLLYEEYIAPLPLRHKEKQLRTRWHDAYQKFISYELRAFDIDQLCELCDIMNNFEAHIHNDIEKFRVVCMDRFMKYDLDTRLTLSAILASNALAQSAQILHKAQRGKVNDNIEASCVWSLKLLNEYADKRLDRSALCVDLNEFQEINLASRRMCRSIIAFAESLKF